MQMQCSHLGSLRSGAHLERGPQVRPCGDGCPASALPGALPSHGQGRSAQPSLLGNDLLPFLFQHHSSIAPNHLIVP